MKKALLIAALITIAASNAQAQPEYSTSAPTSTKTVYSESTTGPWYTKLDTVSNTGTDSVKFKVSGLRHSVSLYAEVLKISGDPSAATLTIYASIRIGIYDGWYVVREEAIANVATIQRYNYTFTGNPGTQYMYVLKGVGTHSLSWRPWILPR